ncbi:MAG: glycine cleavage system aminomethyltransferase GcvT [Phycisphaerales bacterium]|nr:glycine cleavage system aminomethyltransferase GcvT [Phycisphaerales bacterium]NNM26279.1 glycine cleavage system aminomethyltransferase GcvT [Phycisphaerales bacterium]
MTPSPAPTAALKHTPLHQFHVDQGAKMVDFAGWDMPLHYGSIIDEHTQVRTRGGLFDVSHMGRLMFTGRDAGPFLDRVCTRAIQSMTDGQARYGIICNEQGGCRDDVLVYRLGETEYLMVCNASNRAKLLEHFAAVKGDDVFRLEDTTESTAMIAAQGPEIMPLIARHSTEIAELKRYRFIRKNIMGLKVLVSRTGYTGEDGVEVIVSTDGFVARTALKMFLKELDDLGDTVRPTGLGARDSLRLESAMALYGHEITEDIDPLSAGLGFAVTLPKKSGDRFIGQDALERIQADGPARTLVGLSLDTRRAARQGMTVRAGGNDTGVVTSGCLSPTLGTSIAMAYVDRAHAAEGTTLAVDLGRQEVGATVVGLPFYTR